MVATLKRINPLTKVSSSTQGTPRSSLQSPLRRAHTTIDLPNSVNIKEEVRTSRAHGMLEPLPEHNESHAGPYGVEAPLRWDFVVKVTDITVTVKLGGGKESCQQSDQNGDASAEVDVEGKCK